MMNISRDITRIKQRGFVLSLVIMALLISYWMPRGVHAAAGDLDPSFGTGGKVITPISSGTGVDTARGVAVQSDGKIVAAGHAFNTGTGIDFALVRYNADGTLDTSFGTGGIVTTNTSTNNGEDIAFAVAIQADGRIVAAGYAFNSATSGDFVLARYNSDGTLDTAFGTGGKAITNFDIFGSFDQAHAVAIQPDGKIVAAGLASFDSAIARYNADGTLDTAFGTGGKVITDLSINNGQDNAFAVAIQADGRVITAGSANNSTTGVDRDFALACYNPDGTLDTAFGTGGRVNISLSAMTGATANPQDEANAVAIQADGKIVAAGYVFGAGNDFALVRLNADGTFDGDFGAGGIVITNMSDISRPTNDRAQAVVIQPDGRVVAAGNFNGQTGGAEFALARYNVDGTLDTSFDGDGKVITNISPVNLGDIAYSVAVQPNGSIVAAGYADSGGASTGRDFAVVRYDGVTNRPPSVSAGGPYTVNEGGSVIVSATGSDPDDGDTITYAWDLDDDGTFETPGQSATFSAASLDGPSSVQVAVKVTDGGGLSSTGVATINIENVAPTVGAITPSASPVAVDTAVSASASFSDPGTPDTFTAIWNWGDGNTSSGTISGNSASGNHTYTVAGVYTITLSVSDDDGASGQSYFQYVVVYDPDAGFVTGGGWIDSPAGAFAADPSLTGRASFGFNAKYQRGANIPSGTTQFSFQMASLSFHSSTYQWLVVAGARAQFKGEGAINGSGSYGFLLTAIDGQLNGGGGTDRFRIKIWDKATGVMVYDNQMGAAEDSAAATALGGGSIIIHQR